MVWILLGVVGVLVVGVFALLLTKQLPYDPMAPATSTTPDPGLPDGRLSAEDVDLVRFDTALRGYRMDQVDEVLDRLRVRISELENPREQRGQSSDQSLDQPLDQQPTTGAT